MPIWPSTSSCGTERRCACELPSRATSPPSSRSSPRSRSAAASSASTAWRSQATASCARSCRPDWAERGSLIGVMGDVGGGERIVAVGNYVRLRDPHAAEAAFAVADDFQRKGIGTRLLEQLAQRAAVHGHRGVHRRGAAREPGHALRVREHRLPRHPHARRRRRRGQVPDRGDRGLPGARRRTRPRRRDRVAETVLRPEDGRRRRRLGAAGVDRRRAVPQRARGRVHRRRVSRSTDRASPWPESAPTARSTRSPIRSTSA